MLAEIINTNESRNETLGLVENSGIQFLDYELTADFGDRDDERVRKFGQGYFMRDSAADNHLVRLAPAEEQGKYSNPFSPDEVYDGGSAAELTLKMRDSLELYNGVWFPVPYYAGERFDGPYNWSRARFVRLSNPDDDLCRYHVCLAFDTRIQRSFGQDYYAPRQEDVGGGTVFAMGDSKVAALFMRQGHKGQNWVEEWALAVFRDMAPLKIRRCARPKGLQEAIDRGEYEGHYLNLLAALRYMVSPNKVKFIANSGSIRGFTEVDLILDVGNSRSCGLLFEENSTGDRDDDFSDTSILQLRDLNAPENVYRETFESRIEFQQANFDYDFRSARSGRPDAFVWPSLARTGREAARLAANRSGSAGRSGRCSPKRYLWQTDPGSTSDQWNFNHYSYQYPYVDQETDETAYYNRETPEERVFARPVSDYINSTGEALFAGNPDQNMMSLFSGKSTMTFMLLEVFLQAIVQMNSYTARNNSRNKNNPRRLKSVVLTFPPSMPDLEREAMRCCAYEALGIIWKSLGYDPTPPEEFQFRQRSAEMLVPPPTVHMDWDEAQAGQMVYLYQQTQLVYEGNCKEFILDLRRPDADGRFDDRTSERPPEIVGGKTYPVVAARIATIDIGGGTTDLVISDYSFPKDVGDMGADIRIREILRDGFRVAGDDLLEEIIRSQIIAPLREHLIHEGGNDAAVRLTNLLQSNSRDSTTRLLIQQVTQQIFMKVAHRILGLLERLGRMPRGGATARLKGTVGQILSGDYVCEPPQIDYEERAEKGPRGLPEYAVLGMPDARVLDFVSHDRSYGLGAFLPDGSILNLALDVDLTAINRRLIDGEQTDLIRAVDRLAGIADLYKCDVLLLSGRTTRVPGIRMRLLQRMRLAPGRIVTMHSLACPWYPMPLEDGMIGDPKTTVAVGSLLAYKRRSSHKMVNFHVNPVLVPVASPIRFFGSLDNSRLMAQDSVRYRYITKAEKSAVQSLKNRNADPEVTAIYPLNDAKPEDEPVMLIVKEDENAVKIQAKFRAVLSHYLGYRQFDDPNFPCTMMYVIELKHNLTDIAEVKQATQLNLGGADGEDMTTQVNKLKEKLKGAGAVEFRDRCDRALEDYLAAVAKVETDAASLRARLEKEVAARALEDAEQQIPQAEAKKGLFGRLFAKEDPRPAQVAQKAAEIAAQLHESGVDEPVAEMHRSGNREALKNLYQAIGEVLRDKQDKVLEDAREKVHELETLTSARVPFDITISLSDPNEGFYPYDFIKKELAASQVGEFSELPKLSEFKLDDISNGNIDECLAYVDLKLRTVAYESHWTETGVTLQ